MRLEYNKVSPDGYKAMLATNFYIPKSGLDMQLVHLVYLRVSQINGCSYCIDLHWKDAVAEGVEPRKVNAVVAFKNMPFFTEAEKAALSWAEAITILENREVPEELFIELKKHFSEKEIADLTFAAAQMNALNRMAIAFENHAKV